MNEDRFTQGEAEAIQEILQSPIIQRYFEAIKTSMRRSCAEAPLIQGAQLNEMALSIIIDKTVVSSQLDLLDELPILARTLLLQTEQAKLAASKLNKGDQ